MAPQRDPGADRLRALWAAQAILEAYALGRPFDPGISLILDALHRAEEDDPTMNDRLDAALTPEAFDYGTCIVCKQPVAMPLSVLMAAPRTPEGEPRSFAIHAGRCEREHAAIERDDDAEADGEGTA